MNRKYADIISDLKAGTYAPIYILCGEEPYYIDRIYEYIAENALDEMAREFDQQVVYGRDLQGADIAPIIGAARGFAMCGGRKVIIVREAQAIKKWDALAAYLDNMMPQTVLVICYNGKPDKRQGVWKKALDHPQVTWLQSDKLRDYEVEKWINAYIADNPSEIQIDPRVSSILADHLGTDLSAIVGVLQSGPRGLLGCLVRPLPYAISHSGRGSPGVRRTSDRCKVQCGRRRRFQRGYGYPQHSYPYVFQGRTAGGPLGGHGA